MTSNKEESSQDDKVFHLDEIAGPWEERQVRYLRAKEDKSWLEQFGALLKQMAKGANILMYQGKQVARLSDGQLNKTLLAKEQPDIIKKYTVPRIVEVFDEELFAKEQPEMYQQYRSQRLTMSERARAPKL